MSGLKKFIERKNKRLARENKAMQPDNAHRETQDLSDQEFWEILEQFKLESKSSSKNHVEVLQEILEQYSAVKINQFAERYDNLNN